jgi:hypothetical protein
MVSKKQLAAMEALTAAWLQMTRASGRVDHMRLAAELTAAAPAPIPAASAAHDSRTGAPIG